MPSFHILQVGFKKPSPHQLMFIGCQNRIYFAPNEFHICACQAAWLMEILDKIESKQERERKRALVSKSGVSLSLSQDHQIYMESSPNLLIMDNIYIYIYVTRSCKEGKFPTYHKLTHHITKFTKYNQLQSAMYYYQVLLSLFRNQQNFAKCC